MRVIAGTHRGRLLRRPRGIRLRPTSSRVREALFSILSQRLADCRFLDLYTGTGAVAIEAVSRGASHVTCVESDADALKVLSQNLLDCGMRHRVTVRAQTVQQFFRRPECWDGPYDIVFADPPYAFVQEFLSLLNDLSVHRLFAAESRLVVEHLAKTALPSSLGPCRYVRYYRYGDTALTVYAPAAEV